MLDAIQDLRLMQSSNAANTSRLDGAVSTARSIEQVAARYWKNAKGSEISKVAVKWEKL